MLVVESGAAKAGRWVVERRNVRDDFRRAFGDLPGKPNGLAIASDTDNTSESARAGFADFHFVAEGDACGVK
jgi:Na+(H+)/acetate symporter ActP